MLSTLLVLGVGVALTLIGVATAIPLLFLLGAVYVLAGWLLRSRGPARRRPFISTVAVILATGVGASLAGGLGYLTLRAQPPTPDAFYRYAASADTPPGTLLRAEPITLAVPANARAWRILYVTTRAENVPDVASAIVLAPAGTPPGPRPLVAWTHGTTGVAPGCAPSVLPAPFPFDATVPALGQLVAEGWVLVGPDYVGLGTDGGHPYLVGEAEGRSTLDAVRAVTRLPDVTLAPGTVVWGHSQGGHAALWAGILAPRYAPDVEIAGVAALAPATELGALVEAAQHTPVGRIMASYLVEAYSQTYPDVSFDEYVGPKRRARAMASRCLSGPGALVSLLTGLTMETDFFARPASQGPLGDRLRQNVPRGRIAAPLLVAQGLDDDLVLPAVQERFVREQCAAGQSLEYRTYGGRHHVSVVAPDSALTQDLVQWTRDRFSAAPVTPGCRTIAR